MTDSPLWLRTATPPWLAENELHVWRAFLDLSPARNEEFSNLLSFDEKARADKFVVPHARHRFIAGRGIVRKLLGAYLGLAADKVKLNYSSEGKASLAAKHESGVCFNISHSEGLGLFVFGGKGEVGVDVEKIKADFKGMEIASRYFSDEEATELAAVQRGLTDEAFFKCWTKKEAYVKAHGMGLALPLRSFTVRFAEDTQFLRDPDGRGWSCYEVKPEEGYVGAVVAAGRNWSLRYCEWNA